MKSVILATASVFALGLGSAGAATTHNNYSGNPTSPEAGMPHSGTPSEQAANLDHARMANLLASLHGAETAVHGSSQTPPAHNAGPSQQTAQHASTPPHGQHNAGPPQQTAQHAGMLRRPESPQASRVFNTQDMIFLRQAADSNLAGMKLGQLALQKATRPAIKEFGRWMMADHYLTNLRLAAITRKIGVTDFLPELTLQDRELQHKLKGLGCEQFGHQSVQELSCEQFGHQSVQELSCEQSDRQYVQATARDYKITILQFRSEEQYGLNPLLKTYAHHMLLVLRQYLAEAKQLASTGGIAMNTAAQLATASANSAKSGGTATGTAARPAAASARPAKPGGAALGMGIPPAEAAASLVRSGGMMPGMGTPPAAASERFAEYAGYPINLPNR